VTTYYSGKTESLRDLFGDATVSVEPGRITVDGRAYPVVDDVIILLEESRLPPGIRRKMAAAAGTDTQPARSFAGDIQFTFGEEWRRFPEILPEHRKEFLQYFDLVDIGGLAGKRVCDIGCGIGRWSFFLKDACRELVLVDFSEAIFVARRNLAPAENVLYFLGDLQALPFRDDFADFLFCLGVLHHLPTDALEEVRALSRRSPFLLVFLYYALDNRPAHWRVFLFLVTRLRLLLSKVRDPAARSWITWLLALSVYLPLIGLGHLLRPLGLSRFVPLHDFYRGKSLLRIRQDVYDRFFTRIEQRFTKRQILSLADTFREVVVSDRPPYWHFLCCRERVATPPTYRIS
jgi:SAM-dependent methyltransferase